MIELIVNNKRADIFEDQTRIAITYAISDISDVEKARDNTTKTIRLPGTRNNLKIFGFPGDINVTSFKGQLVGYPGVIKEDGTTVMAGVVKLLQVVSENDNVYIDIVIVGNGRPWVMLMEEDLIGTYIGGNHYLTAAVQAASETNNLVYSYGLHNTGYVGGEVEVEKVEDDGNGFCKYTLKGTSTIHNLKTCFVSGDMVTGAGFSISAYNAAQKITGVVQPHSVVTDCPFQENSSGLLREKVGKVYVEDRPLLLNVYNVLVKLFLEYGYQISSTFINSAFFKALFFDPANFKHSEALIESEYCKVGLNAQQVETLGSVVYAQVNFDKVISDVSGHFDTSTHNYTAINFYRVKFRASIKIKSTAEGTAQILFGINGSINYNTGHPVGTVDVEENFTTAECEADFRLNNTDTVQVYIVFPTGYEGEVTISTDETYLEAELHPTITKGFYVDPSLYLPDIKQIDFVKAVRHLFHLHFQTDLAKKIVYIEPRDTYYLSSVLDWSGKTDMSSVTLEELGSELTKLLTWKFKEDSDDSGLVEYAKKNKKTLGEYSGEVLNKFAQDGNTEIVNPLFAPTIMDTFPGIGLYAGICPKIWGSDDYDPPQKIASYEPRIFYMNGITACNPGDSWTFEGTLRESYPLFSTWINDETSEKSLLFCDNAGGRGLFERFYFNYLKTINEGRRLTAMMKLSPVDVAGFAEANELKKDFRSLIRVQVGTNFGNYRIDSIKDYRPGELTKVVLIKNVDRVYTLPVPAIYESVCENNDKTFGDQYANGWVYHHGYVWSETRTASKGTTTLDGQTRGIGSFYFNQYVIERGYFYFPVNLPSGATVLSVEIFIYKISGNPAQEATIHIGVQSDYLSINDFSSFQPVSLVSYSEEVGNFRRFVLNSTGIALFSTNGWKKIVLRNALYDATGNAPPAGKQVETFKTYFNNAPAGRANYVKIKYK